MGPGKGRQRSMTRAFIPTMRARLRAMAAGPAMALALLVAGDALAADVPGGLGTPPSGTETPHVPFTWTGPHAGLQLGLLNGELAIPGAADPSAEGFVGGVHIGYDMQFNGGLVVGGYLDADFGSVPIETGSDEVGTLDAVARGMGRLGFALDRVLVYGQGGVAFVSADISSLGDEDVDEFGYAVGAGIDFALTDKVVLGADYVYHEFTDVAKDDDQLSAPGADLEAHTLRAKLSYKF